MYCASILRPRNLQGGLSGLHIATQNDAAAVVNALLEAGARVNISDQRGFSPAFHAAWDNKVRVCTFAYGRKRMYL